MLDALAVLCGALLLLSASTLALRGVWPIEILVSLAPQAAAVAALLALMMTDLGRPASATTCALAAVLFLATARPLFDPPNRVADADFVVVWSNAFGKPDAVRRAADFAIAEGADVAAFAELPDTASPPPAFLDAFPHRFPSGGADEDGPVVFSRVPFVKSERLGAGRRATVDVAIATESGPLRVLAVHAPAAWSPSKLARQRQIIADAVATAAASPHSVLVGDFNATAWNDSIAAPLRENPRIRLAPLGLAATWLAPFAFVGVPIDHAMATDDLEVEARLGPPTGSDHRPLLVKVRTAQTTAVSPAPR
ncbi:MAG: endonuclease/exonuclease/phosphatase family protein [Parvularculaceae bacterium]|nr:endonuclease/exonuclease/phosphatase family protein [Parvularculaceae bacterium]